MDDMTESKIAHWLEYAFALNTKYGDLVVVDAPSHGSDWVEMYVVDSNDGGEAIASLSRKQARRLGKALIEAANQ